MPSIRLASPADAPFIAEIYKVYVTHSAISFELEAPNAATIRERIEGTLPHFPWLVYENGGEILGYAYASPFNPREAYQWSVNTAIYTRHGRQRRGVGRALYSSLLAALRLQGFYAAHAGITLPNAASVGLHESLGYRQIAVYPKVGYKAGAWHDVGWWQLPLRDRTGEPACPRPLAEAESDPRWRETLEAGLKSSG